MKKSLLIIGAVLVIAFGSFKSGDWYKYKSAVGKYSISFPDKPTETEENDTSAAGVVFTVHYATYSPTDNEVYMVGFIDLHASYPEDKTLKQILEDSRDGAVNSMSATNVVTTTTNLNKDPYIEFTFAGSNGGTNFTGKDRIYVIDKCQYSVIKLNSGEKGSADADRFIGSFKHGQ